jgi:uncharacterized coiled-coil DUF342 family protein
MAMYDVDERATRCVFYEDYMLNSEEEKKFYAEIDSLKKEINDLENQVRDKRWRENLEDRIYDLKRKKKKLEYELAGKDPSTVPMFL